MKKPCSGLRCGLRLSANGRQLPGRGGPGSLGRAGSREFLARSPPHWARGPFLYHSLGLGCRGPSAERGSTAGVRADFFLLSGAPSLPSALPFCRLSVPARPIPRPRPRPAHFLARVRLEQYWPHDNPKSLHVAVCSSATLHFQPSAHTLPPWRGHRPAAFLFSCRVGGLQLKPRSSCPAPSQWVKATSSLLAQGKRWERARFAFLSSIS